MGKRLSKETSLEIAQSVSELWDNIGQKDSFEDTAQSCLMSMYKEFKDSIVLTRMFLTVPYSDLPDTNKNFVMDLSEKMGVSELIRPDIPVLSLVASMGVEADWQSRKTSQRHLSIPLVSSKFIQQIPMMMGLISEITGGLDWIDNKDYNIRRKIMGNFSGTFFVSFASKDKDDQGRYIIAEQDFVKNYNVQSVFGLGGGYKNGSFGVLLIFTKEELQKSIAFSFLTPFNALRAITTLNLESGKVFKSESA